MPNIYESCASDNHLHMVLRIERHLFNARVTPESTLRQKQVQEYMNHNYRAYEAV